MVATAPGWELYHSFLVVIRERSLSAAARALGLTQPTVGRHIDALEQALGVALFTRSQSGLLPTGAALELVPHAEAMASAARALQRAASGEADEDRGAVRVTASEMIGTEVLPQCFAAFRQAHPRVVVELVVSNRADDLLRRDADIAVRMVRPTQSALLARKLGSVRLGMFASPSYHKAHGAPKTLAELANHPLIGFDRQPPALRLDKLGMPVHRELFAFRCDSDVAQYAALRAGFGLGVCQVALGKRDKLVPVLPGVIGFELGMWLVMHRDLKSSRRIRLMYDYLLAHLSAYVSAQA